MAHKTRIYVIGCMVTTVVIFAGLHFMDGKINIRIMEKQKTKRLLDERSNRTKIMEKLKAEQIMKKEQQSLPGDHPDLVFLRNFGRVKNLPTKEEIANMSNKELQYIYHSYLDNTDFACKRKIRMGKVGDGGWEVCDDFLYRPIRPCIVYSFGINDDFSFDDDVARVYGCDVYSFDPSMSQPSHNRSAKVRFFNLGITGETAGLGANMFNIPGRGRWGLKTLSGIKAMLKHENVTLDILKMDIEHAEWSSLEAILQRGELSKVRQLLIEFHYRFRDNAGLRTFLPILQQIEAQGLRRFHTHQNPYGKASENVFLVRRNPCYEVYFANTKLARASSFADENK